jgi:hypothetical protein
MKKWMVVAAAAAMINVSLSGLAAGKTLEERCQAQAEKHRIAAEKLDTYVKTCVEKHHTKHKPAASAKDPAPAAAPAGPGK